MAKRRNLKKEKIVRNMAYADKFRKKRQPSRAPRRAFTSTGTGAEAGAPLKNI